MKIKKDKIIIAIYIAFFIILFYVRFGSACLADVAKANSDVYVRSLSDGEVVGSLKKGDVVIVTGSNHGWNICEIGGKEYKVWHEYLNLQCGVNADEVEVITKPRKSKSSGKADKPQITGKKEKSIKGSKFEDVYFW